MEALLLQVVHLQALELVLAVVPSSIRGGVRGELLDDWRRVMEESEQTVVAHELD